MLNQSRQPLSGAHTGECGGDGEKATNPHFLSSISVLWCRGGNFLSWHSSAVFFGSISLLWIHGTKHAAILCGSPTPTTSLFNSSGQLLDDLGSITVNVIKS